MVCYKMLDHNIFERGNKRHIIGRINRGIDICKKIKDCKIIMSDGKVAYEEISEAEVI